MHPTALADAPELRQCVNDGWVSVKFAYAGQAAALNERFADIYRSDYNDGRAEHEVTSLPRAFANATLAQLCDIGVSNGIHTRNADRPSDGVAVLSVRCRLGWALVAMGLRVDVCAGRDVLGDAGTG
jgi:hypothetical protein